MQALNFFDQAMAAMPRNKEILNNVAEALNGLGNDVSKKNAVVVRVTRRFTEQDAQLAAVMAQFGWYRWGATWVDQMQLDRLKAAEKDIKDRIARLQKDFDQSQTRMTAIDKEIADNNQTMNDIANNSIAYDPNGKLYRLPYPTQYYDFQRKNTELEGEKNQLKTQLDSLRAEAKRTQAQMPAPKYNGVLSLIGIEGTPGATPGAAMTAGATTRPNSAPTTAPSSM